MDGLVSAIIGAIIGGTMTIIAQMKALDRQENIYLKRQKIQKLQKEEEDKNINSEIALSIINKINTICTNLYSINNHYIESYKKSNQLSIPISRTFLQVIGINDKPSFSIQELVLIRNCSNNIYISNYTDITNINSYYIELIDCIKTKREEIFQLMDHGTIENNGKAISRPKQGCKIYI